MHKAFNIGTYRVRKDLDDRNAKRNYFFSFTINIRISTFLKKQLCFK